jgi:hypothetical protein
MAGDRGLVRLKRAGQARHKVTAAALFFVCRIETESAAAQRQALLHYQNITGT